jgi:transposase-like protein
MSSIRNDVDPRQRLTVQQRQRLLARYHRRALAPAEFAARHGIGQSTLGQWWRAERAVAASLTPLRFQEAVLPTAASGWAVAVVNPPGWTVRRRAAAAVAVLPQLLPTLPC